MVSQSVRPLGGGQTQKKLGPEGWGPEGWGAQHFALTFPSPPIRPEAARVSHDSPRALTCTFEGPGLHKHHQNSTRRHPKKDKKSEHGAAEGKKKSEILGGPAEGGPEEGGPEEGVGRTHKTEHTTHTTHTTTHTHTHTHTHNKQFKNTKKQFTKIQTINNKNPNN